jgi:2-phospho-L-lactate transferase/gluconeogenesis factor (CofD/UPF0052 family)
LIPDIAAAIKASRGFKVFVCNVASQVGETDDYSCKEHIEAVEAHVGKGLFDLVVANDTFNATLPSEISWVNVSARGISTPVYMTDLIDDETPSHHDPMKLSETLISLLEERTGPLEMPLVEDFEQLREIN